MDDDRVTEPTLPLSEQRPWAVIDENGEAICWHRDSRTASQYMRVCARAVAVRHPRGHVHARKCGTLLPPVTK